MSTLFYDSLSVFNLLYKFARGKMSVTFFARFAWLIIEKNYNFSINSASIKVRGIDRTEMIDDVPTMREE